MTSIPFHGSAAAQTSIAEYDITCVVTVGDDESRALAINSAGQIVGRARTADSHAPAVLWQDDQIINLGALGSDFSDANSISDAGQIAG